MLPCKADSCSLPIWFDQATLEDKSAVILNCKITDRYYYQLCAGKQKELAEWINGR